MKNTKTMIRTFGIFLLASFILLSCRKDESSMQSEVSSSSGFSPVEVTVNASLSGMVVDAFDSPIAGVEVRVGDKSTFSDEYGFFKFKDIPMNVKGAYVKVDHPQYWNASRRVYPEHNAKQYTKIHLHQKELTASLEAADGGTVELPDGAELNFEPASFQNEAGEAYDGPVNLYMRTLHTADHEGINLMPASLKGISKQDKVKALKSYGIIGVEMLSASGQKLQIKKGVQTSVSFNLHDEVQGNAPQTVAMWHFDPLSGYWRESEHQAQKHGTAYAVALEHFSHWGFFDDDETVTVQGTFVNSQGEILSNIPFTINGPMGFLASGFSNANGLFTAEVPVGTDLNLFVQNACNQSIFGQSLGSNSDDLNLGDINIPDSELQSSLIKGAFVGCSGEGLPNIDLTVCWNQGCQDIDVDSDGSFETVLSFCDTDQLTFFIFDPSSGQSLNITEAATEEVDLGVVDLCDAPTGSFISLIVLGDTLFFPTPHQWISNGVTHLRSTDSNYTLRFSFPGQSTGTFTDDEDIIWQYLNYVQDGGLQSFQASCHFDCGNAVTIYVTEYGPVGGFIEGNYSATLDYINGFAGLVPNTQLTGSFRVPRSQ